MIDMKLIRTNPELVKENIRKKFQDEKLPLVDEVLDLDKQFRETKMTCDDLRNQRKTISKKIGALMGQGKKDEAESVKQEVAAIGAKLDELEQKETESKDMLETMQKALDGKVAKVKLSGRLKSHPVCLSNEGDLSMEMAKTLNAMPGVDKTVQAQTVLELNPEHPIYQKLKTLDDETLSKYSQLLYNQALLIEGMPIADPVAFSNLICELMEA